jgi:hypothetical protein
MSFSDLVRAAAVALPALLVGGGAIAQQRVIVPAGAVVVLLPAGAVPTETIPPMPDIERLIADQRAVMARMMANMDSLLESASMGGGAVMCEQRITILGDGVKNSPVVKISTRGTGCGAATPSAPVPAAAPPAAFPGNPGSLIEVKDPRPMRPAPVRRPT